EHQVGAERERGGAGLVDVAAPGEGGDPRAAVLRGPWLVVEHRDQAAAMLADLHVEHRAHEPPPAHAEPAPRELEAVVGGPAEVLELEGELSGGRGCGWGGHATPHPGTR